MSFQIPPSVIADRNHNTEHTGYTAYKTHVIDIVAVFAATPITILNKNTNSQLKHCFFFFFFATSLIVRG